MGRMSITTSYVIVRVYLIHLLDDIDELQSDIGLMKEFSAAAARDLENAIDVDCLSTWAAGASADNVGDTAGVQTGSIVLGTSGAGNGVAITGGESGNAVDFIMSCNQVLDEEYFLFV